MSGPDRPVPPEPADDRWDAALLAAGFDVDPDAELVGRAAAELAESEASAASADHASLPDPWSEAAGAPSLTEEQRAYVVATSPALGAELPTASLTGDDPFGDVSERAIDDADGDVIEFD